MMNDENQADSTRDDATKEKDSRKFLLLLLLLLLLIVTVVTYIFLTCQMEPVAKDAGPGLPIMQPDGERFEFSAFYHSGDGEWIIRDEGILVLKERKFISESEKDEYTVYEVTPGERVKILQADQRWKRVLVQPDGLRKPVIIGWIDAHHVRNADRIEITKPTTAPKSHKAMKQQYPH